MKLAETVTFGGSGLDRAAHLRGDTKQIKDLLGTKSTTALPIWRGKVLVAGAGDEARIGWLSPDHVIFDLADEAPTFLGLGDEGAHFAYDISDWEPDETPEFLDSFFDPSEQHHEDLPDGHRFAELRGVMATLTPRDAELAATARAILGWHQSHGYCSVCGAKSTVTMSGWQRTCPDCGGHHFPRTDPVVIMLITQGNSVLLGRSPGWPDGMFSLLAGFVEPGEPIEAAVRREVLEETNVSVGEVRYLASQPWPFPASLMLGCHGQATSTEITVDPEEIEEALWVTREEVLSVFAGEHSKIKSPRYGAIAHFLLYNWLADRLD